MRLMLILAAFLFPLGAMAQSNEEAVLIPVNGLMAAMADRNTEAMLSFITPGGSATGAGCGPDGKYERIYTTPLAEYLESYADMLDGKEVFFEPEVRIDGTLATVWGRYTFTVNGVIRHRGHSAFQLVRLDGKWLVLNYSWSTRPQDCGQ
ncbi:nuclear transport factor 2 family protein [Sphingomonas sp. AOB5]|uniref:nuclear transport factor 2 family protein n=1 Tax=Sphingomonas sp. AOB5 TaxID=3034017 RepID=UPI0023F72ED8|nr:nuclear transport factor 2 family protein [Sphingomonas sp. AOB5]MDF7776821.1 nuclear transport factor 2 family protein [Sphingomonas sp. AOB5]